VAQTVHSAQGKTIEGTISVVDCWRDVRLLYTAISRARSLDQVVVVPDELALRVDRRVGRRQMEED
jgi:ATP-dependent exoDNAse (exonuclease V) alpha subunit